MYPGQLGNQYTGSNFQVFIFQVYFNKKYIEVGTQKNTFQVFFFQVYFSKKYVEVPINDFTMHLSISKWL